MSYPWFMSRSVMTSARLIEGPQIEPIDLELVKKHLRFQATSEDALIDLWITAAREYFEEQTDRQIMAATWEVHLDAFPAGVIELPRPPLLEVVSINGEAVDEDVYLVDTPTGPYAARGVLTPVEASWPTVTTGIGAVKVRYRAGYGTQRADVPRLVIAALLMLVGHFHRFRAETQDQARGSVTQLPVGAQTIIRAFRYSALPVHPMARVSWQG